MVGVAAGVVSGIATKVLLLLWAVKDMTTNSIISPQPYIAKKEFSCVVFVEFFVWKKKFGKV